MHSRFEMVMEERDLLQPHMPTMIVGKTKVVDSDAESFVSRRGKMSAKLLKGSWFFSLGRATKLSCGIVGTVGESSSNSDASLAKNGLTGGIRSALSSMPFSSFADICPPRDDLCQLGGDGSGTGAPGHAPRGSSVCS